MAFRTDDIHLTGDINVDGSILQDGEPINLLSGLGDVSIAGSIPDGNVLTYETTGSYWTYAAGGGGGGGGDVGWANGSVGTAQQMMTAAGDGSIVAHGNLSFSGSDLDLTGNMSITGTLDVSPGNILIGGTDARLTIADTTGDIFRLQNQNGVFKIINGTDSDREDLIIDGNGNVGIQITPANPFHVYHATTNSVARFESGDRFGIIEVKDPSATWSMLVDGTDALMRFSTASSGGGTSVLTLTEGGRVGIVDTTPSYELDVNGTTRSTDGFITGNFEIVHNTTSDSLDFNYIG